MEILSIFFLVNLLLIILIIILLVFFVRARAERHNSRKTAKELQKIKEQII